MFLHPGAFRFFLTDMGEDSSNLYAFVHIHIYTHFILISAVAEINGITQVYVCLSVSMSVCMCWPAGLLD